MSMIFDRTRRLIHNLAFDLRYGGFAGGFVRNDRPGATWVVNTDYGCMPQIFAGRIRPDDVLVDVGCGRGRVINWWLASGHANRIVGLELHEAVAEQTKRRLRKFKNVTIVAGDAIGNLPDDGTLFYLSNPFSDEETVRRFARRFRYLFEGKTNVRIIYYAIVFAHVFADDPAWEVEEHAVFPPGNSPHFQDRHRRLCLIRLKGATSDVA